MTRRSTKILVLLRVAIGWIFLYAGITKVLNPDWSAAFYIKDAKTFSWLFDFLASDQILPITNILNEWGLTIIGACLILGVFTRIAGYAGAVMMILYYLPILDFPKVGEHSYLVDEHIIYALVLIFLATVQAGRHLGIDGIFKKNHSE
jgi:thiosulfate dehydrogenase [quinone] large subunit